MNNCVVYEHENLVNGKRYFGITIQKPTVRWGKDGSRYNSNDHFWRAIQKYGWDEGFSHKILFKGLSVAEACEIEEMLIADYKTQNPEYGYNLLSGGQHRRHSEESRRKMSESTKGENHPNYGKHRSEETRRKISENNASRRPEVRRKLSEAKKGEKHPNYGKHHSEETRQRISDAKMGHKVSEETRRKISESLKGHKLLEETRRKMSESRSKKPVEAIDPKNGLRVHYFKSAMEAGRAGFNSGHVSSCCNGKRKTHKGLIWRYVEKESN